jgi:hypothetical protein
MTKLLKSHREALAKRLLDATFRERELRLKQQEHALGLALLRQMYNHEDLLRMAQLPDGWLPLTSHLQFKSADGWRSQVNLSDSVRIPACYNYHFVAPGDWIDKWNDLRESQKALDEERDHLAAQVRGTLSGFTTVEKLAQGWPEGYAHFPHEALAAGGPVPALRIEDLNARLAAAREAA